MVNSINKKLECKRCKEIVKKRLSTIIPVLERVAQGDFSASFPVPQKKDTFTELFVVLNQTIEKLLQAETENQKAWDRLRENEGLHRALVEAADRAGIGIVILRNVKNKEAAIVSVNDRACDISGYSRAEALKMTIKDVLPTKIITQIMSRYRRRQQGNPEPTSYETTIIRKDKKEIPIIVSTALMKFHGDAATVLYFRDITDSKRGERRIKHLQEYLQMQIDRMPIGLIVWDKNFRVTAWNNVATKIFGFTEEEALGKHPYDLIVGKDVQPTTNKILKRLLKGDLTAHSVNKNITKDGRTIICEWTNTPFKYGKGKIESVLSMVQDVTNSKKAEEEVRNRGKELEKIKTALLNVMDDLKMEKGKLKREKAKDAAILENIADGVVAVNKKGRIIIINQAAEKLLGWKSEEALGRRWSDILQREGKEGNFQSPDTGAIQAALSKETVTIADSYYYVRKDKTRFPVLRTVSPIIFDKKVIGAVNVFRDITREKEADRMKDEFLSIASHELRTPMTAITGNIDMVLKGQAGPISNEVREYLDDVATASDRLIKLVDDMLDVSRIEAGRAKFILKPTDIDALLQTVIKDFQTLAQTSNIILKYSSPKKPPSVFADSDKVIQVLNNLISNALKFTQSGSVTVTTDCKKNMVIVHVQDTGVGVSEEGKKKLFQKFSQLDTSMTRESKGTGLGLYVSMQMVKKMGGEIWMDSEGLGKGSTFSFSLPMAGGKPAREAKKPQNK